MQIVIDIPEKIYNRYINYTESYIDFVFVGTEEILVKAIRNGTILPKGHGRLIDADAKNKELADEYHGMISDESIKIYKIIQMLDDAPTIIEADKESD